VSWDIRSELTQAVRYLVQAGKENAPPRIVNKLIAETEDMEDTKYDDSFDALDPLDGGEEDAITQCEQKGWYDAVSLQIC
jgi:hypothetical protein